MLILLSSYEYVNDVQNTWILIISVFISFFFTIYTHSFNTSESISIVLPNNQSIVYFWGQYHKHDIIYNYALS